MRRTGCTLKMKNTEIRKLQNIKLKLTSWKEWTDIFSSVHSVEKPHAECISLIGTAVRSAHETELLKLANKALNAKDTLRTISSIMERSEWGECCLRNPDSCNMPNTKRTPDIAVCVICQSHEDSELSDLDWRNTLKKRTRLTK